MSKKPYLYYVTGFGQWPTDMLRYDRGRIVKEVERNGRKFYVIESEYITHGRWESFLWSVIDTNEKRMRFKLPRPEGEHYD